MYRCINLALVLWVQGFGFHIWHTCEEHSHTYLTFSVFLLLGTIYPTPTWVGADMLQCFRLTDGNSIEKHSDADACDEYLYCENIPTPLTALPPFYLQSSSIKADLKIHDILIPAYKD